MQDSRGDSEQTTSAGTLVIDVSDIGQKPESSETPFYTSDEKTSPAVKDKEKDEKDRGKEADKDKSRERDGEKKGDKDCEKERIKGLEGASLDSLLQRLPGCVSRDLIDQLTVSLLHNMPLAEDWRASSVVYRLCLYVHFIIW